uniref:Uncharacterized protein n=1 Tax=viral metagenome TaxID=1070528 RepID=A0A6M3Y100_9ZZZZ
MRSYIENLLLLFTILCISILLTSCGTFMENTARVQATVKEGRLLATKYFDAECLKVEKACPKKTTDAKLEECKAYVACRDQRRSVYKVAITSQLLLHRAVHLYLLGKTAEAESILKQALLMGLDFTTDLKKYKVIK